jgi:hypothetical protein
MQSPTPTFTRLTTLFLALLSLSLFTAPAPASPVPQSTPYIYTDATHRFTITPPADWRHFDIPETNRAKKSLANSNSKSIFVTGFKPVDPKDPRYAIIGVEPKDLTRETYNSLEALFNQQTLEQEIQTRARDSAQSITVHHYNIDRTRGRATAHIESTTADGEPLHAFGYSHFGYDRIVEVIFFHPGDSHESSTAEFNAFAETLTLNPGTQFTPATKEPTRRNHLAAYIAIGAVATVIIALIVRKMSSN